MIRILTYQVTLAGICPQAQKAGVQNDGEYIEMSEEEVNNIVILQAERQAIQDEINQLEGVK